MEHMKIIALTAALAAALALAASAAADVPSDPVPLIDQVFQVAGVTPVPVECTPAPLPNIPGGPAVIWGLTWIGDPLQGSRIAVYGRVGCASLVYLNAGPAERLALERLNPGWNWPLIVADGLLLDLHEANHLAVWQQRLPAATAAIEECSNGLLTDREIGTLLQRMPVPPSWHDAVEQEIRDYDPQILDWSQCPAPPDPQLP